MLGLFLLSFLVVSSTIARPPRQVEDYDYYSTYDESPAQTESGSNPADTSEIAEDAGAGDYSNNNEDNANDDYSYYDREPPVQKEVGSNPADASEEEAIKKEEDSKKDNNEYWHDEGTRVEDQADIGNEKDAQAEIQSNKKQESNDYDYNYDMLQEKEEDASLAREPEKSSDEGEQDYMEDYEMPTMQDYSTNKEESKSQSKEEATNKSPDYDDYADNYDYSSEMEGPTQKGKDENDMTEQESDYDDKDYEWHDSQDSKDYEEDYVQKRVARNIKRVPRRHRPRHRPHHRHHKQDKQSSTGDISPTPTTRSPHPDNVASSHSQATSSSPPIVPTPSPDSKVEPSTREVLLQYAINSYTVATMHQLDASKILELYKQRDAKTLKFAKTLFKVLVAMRLARVNKYRGFDKPIEVVSLLKKDQSTRHTDYYIVRFLYKYYSGFNGAVKYYLRLKARSSSLELPRHDENEVAHQNQNKIRHHYRHHFHRNGHSKHEVNKRDQTVKGGHRAKDYFKRKLEAFRKKRALVAAEAAAAAKHDTENTANQHRVITDLNVKQVFPQKLFRSRRSQHHHRPHRPQGPILPAVYEAAERQKAKDAGSTCRTPRGGIIYNGEMHKVDCNNCKCRNGELHCTHLKCMDEPIIQISGDMTSTSAARKNGCQKCNVMPKEAVCGANGKTYNSLCHAINCGSLDIMDVRPGSCEIQEGPCLRSQCEDNEVCVPRFRGPCIGVYGYGKIKGSCSLYRCVPRYQCHRAKRRKVCGSDGKTYHSLCSLYRSEATLEYYGSCQPEKCSSPVCGSNGVTYKSSCHPRARSVRIDYTGECLAVKLSKERTCEVVRNEKKRCGKMNPKCKNRVIPHGSCCPICGSSFTMEPDSKEFSKLQESKNHLLTVKRRVFKLIPEIKKKCYLSASLGDRNDITFVLEALSGKDERECLSAGKRAVDIINNESQHSDAVIELLAPAALNQDRLM